MQKMVNGKLVNLTQGEIDQRAIETQASLDAKPAKDAQAELNRLESTITPRRIREALLTTTGKTWLSNIETLIEVERAKL